MEDFLGTWMTLQHFFRQYRSFAYAQCMMHAGLVHCFLAEQHKSYYTTIDSDISVLNEELCERSIKSIPRMETIMFQPDTLTAAESSWKIRNVVLGAMNLDGESTDDLPAQISTGLLQAELKALFRYEFILHFPPQFLCSQ